MEQAAFLQVIMNGTACFLFEQAHHMEFTDEKFLSKNIDGQVFCQVGIDIAQDFQNTVVCRRDRGRKSGFGILHTTGDFDEQSQKQTIADNDPAIFVFCQFLFQSVRDRP